MALRLEVWAEPEWERKGVALLELEVESLAKLTVVAPTAFLSEDALDRAPAAESELKEQVKVEAEEEEWVSVPVFPKVEPGSGLKAESWQALGQRAERASEPELAAVLSMASSFRYKRLFP